MSFVVHDMIEIEASHYRAVGRVRNVIGAKVHVSLEPGGYVPWIDAPALVRRLGDMEVPGVEARILHAGGTTVMLELRVTPTETTPCSANVPVERDTVPADEKT